MSWAEFIELLTDEVGEDAARRVELRLRRDLAAVRVTIPSNLRPKPTRAEIDAALRECGWNVRRAARHLGVSAAWLYTRLAPKPKPKPLRPPLVR